MKLSLLTPPTESPRTVPQVPILRGWPGEQDIAISTSGLPRILPSKTVLMDVNARTAPYEAMARFGATGAAVATNVLSTVLEAEARKRVAQNEADATQAYSAAAYQLDRRVSELRTSETHETLQPAWDQAFSEVAGRTLAQAPNDAVRQQTALLLGKYRVVKGDEVNTVAREKLVSYREGFLDQESYNFMQRATDPTLTESERALGRSDLIRLHVSEAAVGVVKPDKLVDHLKKSLETITVRSAYGEMTKDPLGFYNKGWEKYQHDMPIDDLAKLREQSRQTYYGRESDAATFQDRRNKDYVELTKKSMTMDEMKLETRLAGVPGPEGTPSKPVSDAELDAHMKQYQYVMEPEQVRYWTALRAKTLKDGPSNPLAFRERRYDILTGKANLETIQQDALGQRMSLSETDDLKKILIEQSKRDNIPNYQAGKAQITTRLGLNMLDGLAGAVPLFRPEDQYRLRDIMSSALAEYERRLGSFSGDPVDLGEQIAKKYAEQFGIVLGGMSQVVVPPTTVPAPKTKTPGESIGDLWQGLKDKFKFLTPSTP